MNNAKINFLYLSILWSCVAFGGTSTVIVQNGNNGYTGCEDSYTANQKPNENFSDLDEIMTFNCVS